MRLKDPAGRENRERFVLERERKRERETGRKGRGEEVRKIMLEVRTERGLFWRERK